jgi:hypothetical protein
MAVVGGTERLVAAAAAASVEIAAAVEKLDRA